MPRLANRNMCTGCTACQSACSKRCISMTRDEEGFLQPIVDDRCVECGACERVCPVVGDVKGHDTEGQIAVAGIAHDELLWERSTSGGAFSCISDAFCKGATDGEAVVYGAAFEFPHAVHRRCAASDIDALRKSKYIQSDLGDSFRSVRNDLREGRKVIFAGTPCQVAGLFMYLGTLSHSDNLLCIDLVCHGVGSPAVFEACMEDASKKLGTVVEYEFRCKKSRFGNYERYLSRYKYLDKCLHEKIKYVAIDDYNKLFLSQVCLRRSCSENCQFRTRRRFGDITLADLNGKGALFPEHDDGRGWSTIICNTEKGRRVLESLRSTMTILDVSPDDVAKFNPLFERTTPGNAHREEFFRDFCAGTATSVLAKTYGVKPSIAYHLIMRTPRCVKRFMKRILGAGRHA